MAALCACVCLEHGLDHDADAWRQCMQVSYVFVQPAIATSIATPERMIPKAAVVSSSRRCSKCAKKDAKQLDRPYSGITSAVSAGHRYRPTSIYYTDYNIECGG